MSAVEDRARFLYEQDMKRSNSHDFDPPWKDASYETRLLYLRRAGYTDKFKRARGASRA